MFRPRSMCQQLIPSITIDPKMRPARIDVQIQAMIAKLFDRSADTLVSCALPLTIL